MSKLEEKTWVLARPEETFTLNGTHITKENLTGIINEVVLDTIRPYGSSEHRQGQYKKIEKYDHLLDTINKNLKNLVESVKSDLTYGYLSEADVEFLVNDHFERLLDSISYAGSAIMASVGKNNEDNY